MPKTNPEANVPKPLAVAAGAGDLAVEKIRDLSKRAADRLSTLEADPSAFADKVQVRIETRADALGTAFRSASTTVRDRTKDLSEKAQDALQSAFVQAGDMYETLAKRGEKVVIRLRGESAHELQVAARAVDSTTKPTSNGQTGATPAKKPATRKRASAGKSSTAAKPAARRKTAQSTAKRGGS